MATIIENPAINILDRLINQIEGSLKISDNQSNNSSVQSSFLPSHTTDVAWRPIVPLGHTVYSWVGELDAPVEVNSTPSPEPLKPLAEVKAQAAPAADAAATPAPAKAAKPAKQPKQQQAKKPEPAPVSDQPAISRIDIRVGQVVKASRHPDG